jgi:hypothetical protein
VLAEIQIPWVALLGTVATVFLAWLTWRRFVGEQRNLKLVATNMVQTVPQTASAPQTTFQFVRVELYNKSSSDIGIHGWALVTPQGWRLGFLPLPWSLVLPPTFPMTLRGRHSIAWDLGLAAMPSPALDNAAPIPFVQTQVTVKFGDQTAITSDPVHVPTRYSVPTWNPSPPGAPSPAARRASPSGSWSDRARQTPLKRWGTR